jgi:DNA-directed RNA polymerase subunit beta'
MGLLLDMSPRNLEKVLYFANYIVTSVDEKARAELLAKLDPETDERVVQLKQQLETGEIDRRPEIEARISERQHALGDTRAQLEAERDRRVNSLRESALDLDDRIQEGKSRKAPANFTLTDSITHEVVAKKGDLLDEDLAIAVQQRAQAREQEILEDIANRLQAAEDTAAADIAALRADMAGQRAEHEFSARDELEERKTEVARLREELEVLTPRQLLSDTDYRRYVETFSKVFKAGIGATAVRELLQQINLDEEAIRLREESRSSSGQRRQKAIKRLRVVEAFRKSGTSPAWMILDVLPVIPPELRPMVQLDGGRFATSDLNDLYRRVINRNNRLKRLLELGAPEIIVRNEKRMLQEAVDALVDNGRRGRAITGTGNRKLKSLSDMLKGKQGRFRQNLLGKRVDYSGRSVIVVGPELRVHECGLPKRMALELFKPFVMRELVSQGSTQNIKSAKRMVERVRPEVWDILDQVIKEHPVLLNRAPTLHRLGIQAFMPVLVEGQAIQIHPLVCKAFNADFDGDQMAVHVPLFSGAVAEAKNLMMSSNNILSASNGSPVVAPTQDIVLGSYYLTQELSTDGTVDPTTLHSFGSPEEARLAFEHGAIALHERIRVRMPSRCVRPHRGADPVPEGRELVVTTVGRVILNDVLPLGEPGADGNLPALVYRNEVLDLRKLGQLVKECYDLHGAERTAQVVNDIKRLGFHYATRAGITVAAMDIKTPEPKTEIIARAEGQVEEVDLQFRRGLITEEERYYKTVEIWTHATDEVTRVTMESFDNFHPVLMMSQSGARGSTQQIRQLAGMRGLMADPTGRIIDLPIKANFSEGLTVLEYFISTHGARKGLADTALRTADSGYLTRRLVDVAQDVIIRLDDCETTAGIWIELEDGELGERVSDRYQGRVAAQDIAIGDEVVVTGGSEITDEVARRIYRERAQVGRVKVRSIMTCKAREGVCRMCYGRNLATGRLVEIGEAVGVIAAQSIGEPGTQLTMRTFHTGGVATGGSDITQGLPRVEELFEARVPKGKALISEIDGTVEVVRGDNRSLKIKVSSRDVFDTTYAIPSKHAVLVEDGREVAEGAEVIRGLDDNGREAVVRAKYGGVARVQGKELLVRTIDEDSREYVIPVSAQVVVRDGDHVNAGDKITEGSISPQELLLVRGRDEVQTYLVREVQRVYRSQGVDINDKHIEVIVRQMMRKVRIDNAGDTDLLPGEIVSQFEWEEANAKALSEGGEPAIAQTVLLGLIKAALNTASWLSAASFQETTRVLTEAAISGKVDKLRGLKENVIIGKLIPAGTGLDYYQKLREEAFKLYEEDEGAAGGDGAFGDFDVEADDDEETDGDLTFDEQQAPTA